MPLPDYSRPPFDPKVYKRLSQRPERRRYVKNRDKAKKKLTRAQVREIVYRREKMLCQRCKRRTKRPNECTWEGDPLMAQVNENPPRSKGGDPLDPDQCELTCQECHKPNGEHAPTPERMKKIRERKRTKASAR